MSVSIILVCEELYFEGTNPLACFIKNTEHDYKVDITIVTMYILFIKTRIKS